MLALVTSSTVPALPAPGTVFHGVHVPERSAGAYSRFASSTSQQVPVVSVFAKLNSVDLNERLATVTKRGQTPLVTLELWETWDRPGADHKRHLSLNRLLVGDYDAALRDIGRTLARVDRMVLVRLAHEANGHWYPWAVGVNDNSAAEYVAAWKHVRQVVQSEGAELQWIWAPAATQLTRQDVALADLYPGDAWVDFVGMTAYERQVADPVSTLTATVEQLRDITRQPIILAEVGVSGQGKVSWIQHLPDWLRNNPDVVGLIYFDTSPGTTGATADYSISADPRAAQAFRDMLSRTSAWPGPRAIPNAPTA